jgi:4-amino-4-deoxy-L-arabinose transferase-like glycosyltransferase
VSTSVLSVYSQLIGALDRPGVRPTAIAVFFVAGIICLSQGSPLGWDESVFAARGKDLVDSGFDWNFRSGHYWGDYRAPGLPVLTSLPFKVFGQSDFIARLVVLATAVGVLVMIGRTLDLFWNRRVGTVAVLLVALCPGFLATSTIAFADIPAMFVGMGAVYVVGRYLVSMDARWLVPLPLLLAVTTMIRFGGVFLVAGPLCVLGVSILIRQLRARNWSGLRSFSIAVGLSGLFLLIILTTTLLTIDVSPLNATRALKATNENPSSQWLDDLRTVLTPGAVDYGFNGAFWGWSYAIPFLMLATVAIIRLLVRQWFGVLAVCGIITVVPIALYSLSANQFVTTYLAPIFASGAAMVAVGLFGNRMLSGEEWHSEAESVELSWSPIPVLARLGLGDRRAWLSVAFAVCVGLVALISMQGVIRMHERLFVFEQLKIASIAADGALGQNCKVITGREPQVVWYSSCQTESIRQAVTLGDGVDEEADLQTFAGTVGAGSGDVLGFLLFDGASGEPRIDDIWGGRIEDRSLVLWNANGRRVGLIALSVP